MATTRPIVQPDKIYAVRTGKSPYLLKLSDLRLNASQITGLNGGVGLEGPQGVQGPAGPQGATGPAGVKGDTGATGAQGPIGLTGPQGPAGTDGTIGATGATGAQGPIGLTGPAGVKGDTGATGAQGPAGSDAADLSGMQAAFTAGTAEQKAAFQSSVSGACAKLTETQQAQQTAGATTALLNSEKTGLVDPVSGATISLGNPSVSVNAPSVQAALTADPAGARAAMGVPSTAQVAQAIADAGGTASGTTIVGLSPLWTPVAYSTTIPLDGCKYMPATAVTGPVSFSVDAGALPGASCTVRLVANDTDTPQFVGMTQAPSDGWAPIANTVHIVKFWFDGTSALYEITQLVSSPVVVPIQGVPVILSAAPSTVSLSYSAALLSSSVPLSSAYSITTTGAALSIAAVAVSQAAVNLTLSRAMTASETVTLSYTAPANNQIKSVGGMPAASFTDIAVTNGMVLDDYLTFATFPNFTQSLKNDAGYDTYISLSSAGAGLFTSKSANPSRMLVASPAADQYFEITLDADLADAPSEVIALHNNLTSQVNTTATYSCFGNATTGFWKQQTGGMTLVSGTTPYAASDRARYVRTPTNTLRFEVSKDDGATWIVIASKAVITDGSLYPRIGTGGPLQTIRRPKCNGPVAV